MQPTAECLDCGWEGDAQEVESILLYRETETDPAEYAPVCPQCGRHDVKFLDVPSLEELVERTGGKPL